MYTTAAKVRALLRDYTSTAIDDTAVELVSDTVVVPWINAALNGGSTIASPSALIIAIDTFATACRVAQAVYAKKDTQAPDKTKQWCDEAKQMVKDIQSGTLTDSSVTNSGGMLAADPGDDYPAEAVIVGGELDWQARTESRADG